LWNYAVAIGLPDSRLPSVDMFAHCTEEYYDLHLRGAECHL